MEDRRILSILTKRRAIPCRQFLSEGKDEELLKKIFSSNKGVFFGDQHSRFNIREYLSSKMHFFAKCGVKTIFTECALQKKLPLYESYLHATTRKEIVIAENEIWKDLHHIDPYVVDGKREMTFMVIEHAKQEGIQIVPINFIHEYESVKEENQKKERLKKADPYWTTLIKAYTKNDPSRYIIWVGAAHINLARNLKIPAIFFADYPDRFCGLSVKVVEPSKKTLKHQTLPHGYEHIFYLSESPYQTSDSRELLYPGHSSLRLSAQWKDLLASKKCSAEIHIGPRTRKKKSKELYFGQPLIHFLLKGPVEVIEKIKGKLLKTKVVIKEFEEMKENAGDDHCLIDLTDNCLTIFIPNYSLFKKFKNALRHILRNFL